MSVPVVGLLVIPVPVVGLPVIPVPVIGLPGIPVPVIGLPVIPPTSPSWQVLGGDISRNYRNHILR